MPFVEKVVIDTNVIVSALIGGSFPKQILYDFVLSGKVSICLSSDVFKEYVEVLNRPKFKKYPEFVTRAEIILGRLYTISTKYIPAVRLSVIADEPDNRILELALTAEAHYIITGNTNDLTFSHYADTKVVTPEQFIHRIE